MQVEIYQADLRYIGQGLAVTIKLDFQALSASGLAHLRELFEAEHERLFTYRLSSEVEIISIRIIIQERKHDVPPMKLNKAETTDPPASVITSRTTLTFEGQHHKESPIWDRLGLKAGHVVQGPCVISEMDSTTLVHPGYRAEIDDIGNVLIWELAEQPAPKDSKSETELDSFSVDIFENALRNARNEMDTLVTRTAMSPAIREQQDEFPVIAEPGGKMIVGQFGSFIGEFLESWSGTIDPSDIFMTNDPYSVAGAVSHHNDWLFMMPIFVDEKLSKLMQSLQVEFSGTDT